jgi:hypothetical protein
MTAPQGSPAYHTGVREENGTQGAESLSRACLDDRQGIALVIVTVALAALMAEL